MIKNSKLTCSTLFFIEVGFVYILFKDFPSIFWSVLQAGNLKVSSCRKVNALWHLHVHSLLLKSNIIVSYRFQYCGRRLEIFSQSLLSSNGSVLGSCLLLSCYTGTASYDP